MKNIYWVYILLRVLFVKGQRNASPLGIQPVPDRYEISQPIPANPNQIYSGSASRNQTRVFWFQQDTTKGTAKIQVWSKTATVDAPILIVIKRHVSVLSWQIPAMLQEVYPYLTTNRTLCPALNHYSSATNGEPILPSGVEDIFVEVLTLSDQPIDFSLKIEPHPTFVKNGLSSFIMRASPSAPQYIQYNMRPKSTRVLVKLEALEGHSFCGYLSVQSVRCPVGDLESELRLDGRFQTITSKGAIEVDRSLFSDHRFYIVVVVQPHDRDCASAGPSPLDPFRPNPLISNHSVEPGERLKVVRITVSDAVGSGTVVLAAIVPIGTYLLFSLLSIVFLRPAWCTGRRHNCRRQQFVGKCTWGELPIQDQQWSCVRWFGKACKCQCALCCRTLCPWTCKDRVRFQWEASLYKSNVLRPGTAREEVPLEGSESGADTIPLETVERRQPLTQANENPP